MVGLPNNNLKRRVGRLATAAVIGLGAVGLGGCNNALEGGATGAAFGALAGMGLGALGGNMGKGAAAGAIWGGLWGGMLGDQNARRGGYGYYGDHSYYHCGEYRSYGSYHGGCDY